jgi:hypothetical protein
MVKINEIIIKIGDRTVSLTPLEAMQLNDELNKMYPSPPVYPYVSCLYCPYWGTPPESHLQQAQILDTPQSTGTSDYGK